MYNHDWLFVLKTQPHSKHRYLSASTCLLHCNNDMPPSMNLYSINIIPKIKTNLAGHGVHLEAKPSQQSVVCLHTAPTAEDRQETHLDRLCFVVVVFLLLYCLNWNNSYMYVNKNELEINRTLIWIDACSISLLYITCTCITEIPRISSRESTNNNLRTIWVSKIMQDLIRKASFLPGFLSLSQYFWIFKLVLKVS